MAEDVRSVGGGAEHALRGVGALKRSDVLSCKRLGLPSVVLSAVLEPDL